MTFSKLSPVMVVDAIEPCLPFWIERLGFAQGATVPDGDRLGFVILSRDNVEVMYQTRASVAADMPALADLPGGNSITLYIDVSDLDVVERAMHGVPLVVPRRKTFYGADELGVREPGGNIVLFAQHV